MGWSKLSVRLTKSSRSLLVISEVALALVLLVGAGLLLKSFQRLLAVSLGFNPRNVLTLQLSLPLSKYSENQHQAAFLRRVLDRIKTLPGVQSAGASFTLPLVRPVISLGFTVEGRSQAQEDVVGVSYSAVTPNYFRTMGIPLLKGRDFTDQDGTQGSQAVIISETAARRVFPNENPLGKRIDLGVDGKLSEIVGVVGDVRDDGLEVEPQPHLYDPYSQKPNDFNKSFNIVILEVRTASSPMNLARSIQNEILAVDKDQPASRIQTMEQVTFRSVAERRLTMFLLGIFATVALLLAAVGLYGVMAYTVTQRTHEIGIRLALGARQNDVFKLIVGQGMLLTLVGVVIGLVGSYALTRLIASQLYQVTATDPGIFVGISLLLAAVAISASYIPARRAMKVDPIVALRYE